MKFNVLFAAWVVAVTSTLGSLFFSEAMGFIPCSLCWYQRIAMYPLTLILAFGLFPVDNKVFKYSAPLALAGWLIAFYHNLIQWGIIPEGLSPCRQGVPCSAKYINWFEFITIPFLSLIAFSLILISLIIFKKHIKEDHHV